MTAKIWGVFGSEVKGPYESVLQAKEAYGISRSYDQKLDRLSGGSVYRYGPLFIGTASGLTETSVSVVPRDRERAEESRKAALAAAECPKPSIESIRIDPLGNTFDVTWRQEVRNLTGFAVTTRRYGYEGLVS